MNAKGVGPLAQLVAANRQVQALRKEVGDKTGRSSRQCLMLAELAKNPGMSQAEIAKVTGIDRSTTADIVLRLLALGLIQRRDAEFDKRAYVVHITPAGERELKRIFSLVGTLE